jgi:hypothetical protein
MIHSFFIFVPTAEVDENVISYTEVIDWGVRYFRNPDRNNDHFLILSYDDVFIMQNFSEIFYVINDAGNILTGMYETDAIFSNEIKKKVYEALKNNIVSVKDDRLKYIVERIMQLLTISINLNKGIYFRF